MKIEDVKDDYVEVLVRAGWTREEAEADFKELYDEETRDRIDYPRHTDMDI